MFLVWCQTILSLPAILPQNVEEVLKPYFTFTQVGLKTSYLNEYSLFYAKLFS